MVAGLLLCSEVGFEVFRYGDTAAAGDVVDNDCVHEGLRPGQGAYSARRRPQGHHFRGHRVGNAQYGRGRGRGALWVRRLIGIVSQKSRTAQKVRGAACTGQCLQTFLHLADLAAAKRELGINNSQSSAIPQTPTSPGLQSRPFAPRLHWAFHNFELVSPRIWHTHDMEATMKLNQGEKALFVFITLVDHIPSASSHHHLV